MGYPKKDTTIPCVYKLTLKATGKIYIGQSKNFSRRLSGHRMCFKDGADVLSEKHYSYNAGYLEMIRDAKGASFDNACEYEILEAPPIDELNRDPKLLSKLETKWIRKTQAANPLFGYNTQDKAALSFKTYEDAIHPDATQAEPIYVYNTETKEISKYRSCSEFAISIGMMGLHVAQRARDAHLARHRTYFVFFVDKDKRTKALRKHFNKFYPKLIYDLDHDTGRINYNASINRRINYALWHMSAYEDVVNSMLDANDVDDLSELAGFDNIRKHLKSLEKAYISRDLDEQHKVDVEYYIKNNIPCPDNTTHRGNSIVAYNIKTGEIRTYFRSKDMKEINGTHIHRNIAAAAARGASLLLNEWFVYFANSERARDAFEAQYDRLKRRGLLSAYGKGFFISARVVEELNSNVPELQHHSKRR